MLNKIGIFCEIVTGTILLIFVWVAMGRFSLMLVLVRPDHVRDGAWKFWPMQISTGIPSQMKLHIEQHIEMPWTISIFSASLSCFYSLLLFLGSS